MLLTVDIGNANSHLGVFEGDNLVASWDITTAGECTVDEAFVTIRNLPGFLDGAMEIDASIIASVVPRITQNWAEACMRITGKRSCVVGPGLKTGIKMRYNDPAEIGADRISDFVAAKAAYETPFIIVDFGTATNIEVADADGAFLGGVIAPGLDSSARALASSAAQLCMVNLQMPDRVVGKSTRAAIQSGVLLGEVARIDGLVQMIWDEMGCAAEVIATGNVPQPVLEKSRTIGHYEPDLTLKGLRLIYELNHRK